MVLAFGTEPPVGMLLSREAEVAVRATDISVRGVPEFSDLDTYRDRLPAFEDHVLLRGVTA
ncbi:MAG: hypothetical protein HY755_09685 [Nitrospirae bacterium]|nr:hypothetical protein [Nitrospirota bacterium]